jgi:predicted DNA-binding transcriptional regulator AlpA
MSSNTNTPGKQGLIWITEAMVKYGHSRNWFNNRIKSGDFEQVPQMGTSKVYLKEAQIAAYLKAHPEEQGPKNNPGAAA